MIDHPLDLWLDDAKQVLGLSDWEVELVTGADLPDDCLARINIPTGRRTAEIKLGEEYEKSSPEEKRATLVHELLHCHFDPLGDLAHRALPQTIGEAAWHVYEEASDLLLEQAIDAVAVAIAPFLPVPPEGSR
jgi:hypothetical protein